MTTRQLAKLQPADSAAPFVASHRIRRATHTYEDRDASGLSLSGHRWLTPENTPCRVLFSARDRALIEAQPGPRNQRHFAWVYADNLGPLRDLGPVITDDERGNGPSEAVRLAEQLADTCEAIEQLEALSAPSAHQLEELHELRTVRAELTAEANA